MQVVDIAAAFSGANIDILDTVHAIYSVRAVVTIIPLHRS